MAEAAVASALTKIGVALGIEVLKFVGCSLSKEASLLAKVPKNIQRLEGELSIMHGFLTQLDMRECDNPAIQAWIKQVRNVAYSIEDVMDEYIHIVAQPKGKGFGNCMKRIVKGSQSLVALVDQLKEIETNLNKLLDQKNRWFQNNVGGLGTGFYNATDTHINQSSFEYFVDEDDLVGIENNRKKVIELLLSQEPSLRTITLWGMGGVGKTTLVRNIYKKEGQKFGCHAWISISHSYKIEDILRNLLVELYNAGHITIPNDIQSLDVGRLKEKLTSLLQERKFLIILDDVWNPNVFYDICGSLTKNDKGSRIIITTRINEVASVAHDTCKIEIKPLSDGEAWDLFCKRAFWKERDCSCPPDLKDWALKIVRKCERLPLALVSIGSLMSRRPMTEVEWKRVNDQLSSELQHNPSLNHVEKILNLSYDYLPRHLKNCFLYCSSFPEDYLLRRKKLLRLWIAEGFIEKKGARTLEEVAEDYLTELIHRSMLQVVEKNSFGRVKRCRMHDLVRELAISLSRKENFNTICENNNGRVETYPDARRLSMVNWSEDIRSNLDLPRLRSFLAFDTNMPSSSLLSSFYSKTRYLTVIDLEGIPIETIPESVDYFFNLKII